MLLKPQETENQLPPNNDGRRPVIVVGVKLDQYSRQLLAWVLVKVAQPGDSVIAIHVLSNNNENVDQDGKASLFSLVKAFGSVIGVHEGFCNPKQVDLSLKVCRGSSVKKILVREAKLSSAGKVVVGIDGSRCKIKKFTSVAKYCGKKLPMDCGVLAVSNGKVVYQRDGSPAGAEGLQGVEFSRTHSKGMKDRRSNSLLSLFQRTSSKNHRVLSEADTNLFQKPCNEKVHFKTLEQALIEASVEDKRSNMKQNCSVCPEGSFLKKNSAKMSTENSISDSNEMKSLAIVPAQRVEIASNSITMLIKELPECRPGWPLLRRALSSDQQAPRSSSLRRMSVVQWALRLPSRHPSRKTNSDHKQNDFYHKKDQCFNLDGESGAIVSVGSGRVTTLPSPNNNLKTVPKELQDLHEKYLATCRLFSYGELSSATSNFLTENLIGKGGSSQVYKGRLPDGKEIAVKILKPSEDVLNEFLMEIEIITTLSHKNIISLLGFCYEDNNLVLVYDLLSKGSLEENLHGNKKGPVTFGWNERYKVALAVAEALSYLHGSEQPVIHRDVKSSNILLSDDFEPQLSDFGLAKWASKSSSHITCMDVVGTFGYLAPEYFMYGKINEKIDVYSFGVVLLEILSGRKPISNDHKKGQESLVMWAKPILYSGKFTELLYASLASDYDHDQMDRMVLAATLCVMRAPRARPQMNLVLKLLQGDAEVTKWARQQVNAIRESERLDDESCPHFNIQSHLNIALLDVEDDSLSMTSVEPHVSLEDYLRGRWSRSSSFD